MPTQDEDGAAAELATGADMPRPRTHPYPMLQLIAKSRSDAQDERTTFFSRFRNYVRDYVPEKWPESGDMSDDDAYALMDEKMRVVADGYREQEKKWDAILGREIKRHPLFAWAKEQDGLGEITLGLLCGGLEPFSRFANPGKMLAYCGYGDPKRSRKQKGQKTNFDPSMRTTCIRLGIAIRMRTPGETTTYRNLYDTRKMDYAARPWCGECRPANSTPEKEKAKGREHCTPGHIDGKALRYAVKQLLISLWVEATRGGRADLGDRFSHAPANVVPLRGRGHTRLDDRSPAAPSRSRTRKTA